MLISFTEVRRPASRDEIPEWREGCAWLAGGTWLFSTPQIATRTLIDLETLRWPAVSPSANGLEIAATCTIAELERFAAPSAWIAAPLIKLCCHALLMSFFHVLGRADMAWGRSDDSEWAALVPAN